jgi:hypothetical protein
VTFPENAVMDVAIDNTCCGTVDKKFVLNAFLSNISAADDTFTMHEDAVSSIFSASLKSTSAACMI